MEHTSRKKQNAWSIQVGRGGMSGAYKVVSVEHTTRTLFQEARKVWIPQWPYRQHPENASMHCHSFSAALSLARRQPPSTIIFGGDILCLCEYLPPDCVLQKWGGSKQRAEIAPLDIPDNIIRRFPSRKGPEDIPEGIRDAIPQRVHFDCKLYFSYFWKRRIRFVFGLTLSHRLHA